MTKKAIKEKYTNLLNEVQDSIQFYKEELEKCINAYCTLEEIGENGFRNLLRRTLDRISVEDRNEFVRDWNSYEKAKREATVITEILADIQ